MAVSEEEVARREEALKIKDQGNAAFKAHHFQNAVKLYTQSLKLAPSHIVFGNRAQAYIELSQYELALRDLNTALTMEPTFAKNSSRRTKVLAALGMMSEARADTVAKLRHAPNEKIALADLNNLKGKANARYREIKQWNGGEEFEDDEMISIPIAGIEAYQEAPVTKAPAPATVSTDDSATEGAAYSDDEGASGEREQEEEAVAPAVEASVSEEKAPEASFVQATVTAEDTVPVAIDTSTAKDTVHEDDRLSEATTASVKDFVEREDASSVLTAPSVREEDEEDTVSDDEQGVTVLKAPPISETASDAAPSPTPNSGRTATDSYVSATEPESRTESDIEASWEKVKDQSFASSISDLHTANEGLSDQAITTSPTTPNDTRDEEEEEKAAEPTPEATVLAVTTVVKEKEDTVAKKENETTVVKNEEDTVVKKKMEVEAAVAKPTVLPPPASNYSNFVIAFDQLKHSPKAFGEYFLSIPPSSYFSVFSNLMQPDHIRAIVVGLTDAANGEVADLSLISSCLLSLCDLPRFDIMVLFMSDEDKEKAFSLIDILPKTAETAQIRLCFE